MDSQNSEGELQVDYEEDAILPPEEHEGDEVVMLDQHMFDRLEDLGGDLDEALQMTEASEMAEAIRLDQVCHPPYPRCKEALQSSFMF